MCLLALAFFREREPIKCIRNVNPGFIRWVQRLGSSHNGYLQEREPGNPVAIESKNLEPSGQERPTMQPLCEAASLEVS